MSEDKPFIIEKNPRLQRLLGKTPPDELIETICANVSNGGTLIELCKTWEVSYGVIMAWINAWDFKDRYNEALEDRKEWMKQKVLSEITHLMTTDIAGAYNDDGSLKELKDMPLDILKSIQSIDIIENTEGKGVDRTHVGFTKKVKFYDKLKALEMAGRYLKMFTDKVEHDVGDTLEKLLAGSHAPPVKTVGPSSDEGATKISGVQKEPDTICSGTVPS